VARKAGATTSGSFHWLASLLVADVRNVHTRAGAKGCNRADMSEQAASCDEPRFTSTTSFTTPLVSPTIMPRKRRRRDESKAVDAKDDAEAANSPTFVLKCERSDETHVQQDLLRNFLAAREQKSGTTEATHES
jgi:hypothetical protein